MAGTPGEESGVVKSLEPMSSSQRHCQSGEALAEWRSSDQVQNGVPSTSPPYWDVDDNDDFGPKPSELFGRFTWKIDKFSQINKRELRSNAFEIGGYKWYILIYPQGCDVCNHLSLFLCVANHDKLLPGWSHFAQFTISMLNKDPKKSKYSDTLHRFWKKEHDWGWKKFMELSKVFDGFVEADSLTIKAQVQVIRERADRPFRCLDCMYRRELVRVYLTNVEQICRRFVEERRSKLGKLIEDRTRWSSFCAFWMGIDQDARLLLSKDKKDVILRVVVKHFFVEKEVTSTLVMDSLYSGLKALECQMKSKKGRGKSTGAEDLPVPIVRIEEDMFVLVDDVLKLLERAALEPLPPKDEKGPQNRTKDGPSVEDFNKDSIERDERRLTELGRRTIEIFILAHIFSKIEVAYKEAVAFERQEELIREEEAAWLAEIEQKAKRAAAEKEKKSKKKQGKQKRNSRKGKDKGQSESNVPAKDELQQKISAHGTEVVRSEEAETAVEKADLVEDVSDVSDSVPETPQPDSEDREASPVNWDTDASEVHPPTEANGCGVGGFSALQNGKSERNSSSLADDSSSTCSTDSVPSVVTNGPYRGNSTHPKQKNQKSPSRGRNRRGKVGSGTPGWAAEAVCQPPEATVTLRQNDTNGSSKTVTALEGVTSLQDRMKELEQHIGEKEKVVSQQSESSTNGLEDTVKPSKEKAAMAMGGPPPPSSPSKSTVVKSEPKSSMNPVGPPRQERAASPLEPAGPKIACPKPTVKPAKPRAPVVSRPLSAPISPAPKAATTVVSTAPKAPVLARSVSAAGRLGRDASAGAHCSVPPVQSYRNAMMGTPVSASSSQTPNLAATPPPEFCLQSSVRTESTSVKPAQTVRRDLSQNGSQLIERPQRDSGRSVNHHSPAAAAVSHDPHHFYNPFQEHFQARFPVSTSGRLGGLAPDEFPHLDIINDLLDDENGLSKGRPAPSYRDFSTGPAGPHHLSRQFSFPGNLSLANEMDPLASSCRYDRTQSYYDDGYHLGYGGQFDPVLDTMYSQANLRPYQNGLVVDPFSPNQWQHIPDMYSPPGMRSLDSDGYGYHHHNHHIRDYSSVESSVNGYTVFRPSNGH